MPRRQAGRNSPRSFSCRHRIVTSRPHMLAQHTGASVACYNVYYSMLIVPPESRTRPFFWNLLSVTDPCYASPERFCTWNAHPCLPRSLPRRDLKSDGKRSLDTFSSTSRAEVGGGRPLSKTTMSACRESRENTNVAKASAPCSRTHALVCCFFWSAQPRRKLGPLVCGRCRTESDAEATARIDWGHVRHCRNGRRHTSYYRGL